jgi:hypothetical protein
MTPRCGLDMKEILGPTNHSQSKTRSHRQLKNDLSPNALKTVAILKNLWLKKRHVYFLAGSHLTFDAAGTIFCELLVQEGLPRTNATSHAEPEPESDSSGLVRCSRTNQALEEKK